MPTNLTNLWLVSGRIPFDDENTTPLFIADSSEEAASAFNAILYEDQTNPEALMEVITRENGAPTFVNTLERLADMPLYAAPKKEPKMKRNPEYTHLEMEAALCIWEHLLEDPTTEVTNLRETIGAVALRHNAIALARPLDNAFGAWCEKYPDLYDDLGLCYDWEVIPALVNLCQIVNNRLVPPSESEIFVELTTLALRSSTPQEEEPK